jgi:TolB protein
LSASPYKPISFALLQRRFFPYSENMIRVLLSFAALLLSILAAMGSPGIAFERGNNIWIANTDGSNARKLAKGSAPDLSADGSRVTFTIDSSTKTDPVRQIAIADVSSGKVKVFKDEMPGTNCQRGVFSPDGTRILFEIWTNADWHLALINADGSGFRYLKKTNPKGNSFWSTCWAPDERSIYAQNLNEVCQFDLDGAEIKKWKIESLFPKAGLSSASTLAISPDGRNLLADAEMQEEEAHLPDWDGPPPALWVYDFANQKSTRLTPKGLIASKPCWLNEGQILFTAAEAGAKQPSIYLMNVAEKTKKVLIKNASNASVSR